MTWMYTPDKDHGLTEIGEHVVREMFHRGVIVDLTHSVPGVRRDVFRLNRQINADRIADGLKPRPLVFTHTGAQQIYEYYDQHKYPFYKYYCVSDEEIELICDCGGVIGVIPENFWLVGADTHLKKNFDSKLYVNGIPYIIETMKYINSKTPLMDFSNIGIGTDFDGLADNPKDLYKNRQLVDLIDAMQRDPDINDEAIYKITYKNALRLLEYGWG